MSAPELENLIIKAVHDHWLPNSTGQPPLPANRDLVVQAVKTIIVRAGTIDIHFFPMLDHPENNDGPKRDPADREQDQRVISIPWERPPLVAAKGVLHSPAQSKSAMTAGNQADLLTAIAKARLWIDDLAHGRVKSFADIAKREGRVERHIRLLAPLAFVPPARISAIVDRTAPATGVIELAKGVAYGWNSEQK